MALTVKIVSVNLSARQLNVVPVEKYKDRPEHKKKMKHKNKQKKRKK